MSTLKFALSQGGRRETMRSVLNVEIATNRQTDRNWTQTHVVARNRYHGFAGIIKQRNCQRSLVHVLLAFRKSTVQAIISRLLKRQCRTTGSRVISWWTWHGRDTIDDVSKEIVKGHLFVYYDWRLWPASSPSDVFLTCSDNMASCREFSRYLARSRFCLVWCCLWCCRTSLNTIHWCNNMLLTCN